MPKSQVVTDRVFEEVGVGYAKEGTHSQKQIEGYAKTMSKGIAKILMAIGMVAVLGATGCTSVTVTSTPPGAKVYKKQGNQLIGKTPLKVKLVAANKEYVLRKEGYFSKTVVVSPTDSASTSIELQRRQRVLVLTDPPGAELYVKDVGRVGATPYQMDYSKPYRTFEVRMPGYDPKMVTVSDDPEGNVIVELDRGDALLVVSKPKNAEVYDLEGNSVGVTPLSVPASEKQTYEMRKDGYYTVQFKVDEETKSPLVVELKREPIILVQTEPAGAYVVHRGVTLGQTPFRHLVKEDMEIEIKADRYYTQEIMIGPDSPRTIELALEPLPYVTINSDPAGAQLYRSGGVEYIGATPIEVLVEKDSAFELHKKGYKVKPFMLSPAASSEVTVPLVMDVASREKTVLIDSEPSGAKVYRPGGAELVGKTPFKQRILGERTYELHLEGYETKIVTIAADSADSVVFDLVKSETGSNVTVSDPLLNTPASF